MSVTHMSVLVQRVVGELEFEEGHRLLHPVAPGGWRVRVDIRPAGWLGLRFSRHLPFLFIPLQEGDKTRREVESAVRPTGSSFPPKRRGSAGQRHPPRWGPIPAGDRKTGRDSSL